MCVCVCACVVVWGSSWTCRLQLQPCFPTTADVRRTHRHLTCVCAGSLRYLDIEGGGGINRNRKGSVYTGFEDQEHDI